MYAVIRTGGKQYRVSKGDTVEVEKLGAEVGDDVRFSDVLLVGSEEATTVGRPTVSGAEVVGKVVFNGRAPKIVVFKMKRRKGYRRKAGHRQAYTRVVISDINLG
ncbi:MAG TPA: 50S ribosomal protein L21 [Myxococcota bacterium]|mgnify:CR=1 FL=1|nr:50S ribosomal protein L21 [Myxococcota bacterium]HON26234.1 50S ribosomal protein L21 [Myxococcota bacterium]HOS63004.1 50S ribosomal protein L21 [Myxococcota bacterium]HPC93016.1 50S ribosomal protein L21 [Myxococcota bacterium]HPL26191.1 50S ribosomal protein L21 [Myxococcota bacterium]